MTLSGLAYLWFALAIGCILAGMALTGKRLKKAPPPERVMRRVEQRHRRPPESGQRAGAFCTRCAQPLESGARFCGACGLALPDRRRAHSEREHLSRQA